MFTLRERVPLAPLTTFKVGGVARYYSEASVAMYFFPIRASLV